MKAIKSNGGTIVPERSVARIAKSGDYSRVYVNSETPNYGGVSLDFDESSDELAAMLGWDIMNEKGTDGVDARLAARLVDLTRERDEALAKLDWLARWRKQSETPCRLPQNETVEWSSDGKIGDGLCFAKVVGKSEYWRPSVGCLGLYEKYKDV